MDAFRTLEILITSRTPLIAIETLEEEPLKALRNLGELPSEGVYLVKDLHRSLGKAAVVRSIRDLAHVFSTRPLSVTRAEGAESLREWARGRAVPAA
jgi:hypothetical protein